MLSIRALQHCGKKSMQNNFTWYLKFHAGGRTIFSQIQQLLKIYSIIVSLIWRKLCRVNFPRFWSLTSVRVHYLAQSDWSHVSCEVTKLRTTVTSYAWSLNRLTTTWKHWFPKTSWIHELMKQLPKIWSFQELVNSVGNQCFPVVVSLFSDHTYEVTISSSLVSS